MEDGAGWWYFGLEAASPLLNLTNDTLCVTLAFGEGPTPPIPAISAQSRRGSKDSSVLLNPLAIHRLNMKTATRSLALYPLFPTATHDPAMLSLFDNANLSDYSFKCTYESTDHKLIHVQKCFLQSKLPLWNPKPVVPPKSKSSELSRKKVEEIADISYSALHSFLTFVYAGQLPLLETDSVEAQSAGQLCILCERFGHFELRRFLSRFFYSAISHQNVLKLLRAFGGRSDHLQEILVFFICKTFASIRGSSGFKKLITDCVDRAIRKEERCISSKRLLAVLRRLSVSTTGDGPRPSLESTLSDEGSPVLTVPPLNPSLSAEQLIPSRNQITSSSNIPPVPALDPRRSIAFRTLLSTASVSDVHFIVEGKTIYAQKCILSSLSEFFSAMFSGTWAEGSSSSLGHPTIIQIMDFPHKTFQGMLNYLYLEELDAKATLTDLGLLHICADKYQLLDLMKLTQGLISEKLSPTTVAQFLFGFAYQYDSLNVLATTFFIENFDAVKRTQEFTELLRKPWELDCCDPDVWGKLWGEILEGLVVLDFEKCDVVLEESGGVGEYLDPNPDAFETEGENLDTMADTFVYGDLDKSGEKEKQKGVPFSLYVETGLDNAATLSAESAPTDSGKSENDEFLDPQPIHFEIEDGLNLEAMNLAQELSEAEG
ncbi:hypothetical protein BDR26DRAFT_395671 [Obelidium mucronatum]|nr:hypothetical protein BDR26DRAFT_395671 [Obelidium mucronatum]